MTTQVSAAAGLEFFIISLCETQESHISKSFSPENSMNKYKGTFITIVFYVNVCIFYHNLDFSSVMFFPLFLFI